ncbi:MAG: hypothetical protein CMM87_00270 [Rickettsiales bacterium]|nr:hypothetical protein [Rickettsiales bacterium]|tara:strand:- start:4330 stop:5568 length:1239 start_codon:yes stop_codon:yes gene_type:complete
MNISVFIIAFTFMLGLSLWVGRARKDQLNSNKDFYLSGRNLRYFGLTLSFLATQLGGGALIGAAQAAYQHGIYAFLYAFGLSLGLIFLSFGIGARFRQLDVHTLPELFTKYYQSPFLRIFSGLISITSLFLILVAIGISARKFFITLGLESELWFMVFACTGILYTVMGGLSAVVRTDVLQGIFIAIVLVGSLFFIDFTQSASTILQAQGVTAPTTIPWSDWLLMPMLFVIIGQDMSQRCFAASNPKGVSRATLSAGFLLLFLSLIPVVLGLMARQTVMPADQDQSILMVYMLVVGTPIFNAFFALAILMAILSTMDSLVCSISSNINYDLFFFLRKSEDKLWLSRGITLAVGVAAMILSIRLDGIIELMLLAYQFSIYTLFVPILLTAFYKGVKKWHIYLLMAVGLGLFFC